MSDLRDDESIFCPSVGSSFISEEDYESLVRESHGVEYLSNVDYSLNSPLISDEIIEFLKYARGQPFRRSWNIETWKIRKETIKREGSFLHNVRRVEDFHKWFGQKSLSTTCDASKFREILHQSQIDSDSTFPVVQAFMKGWLDKDIINLDKTTVPMHIMKWGAYFLDLHIATLLLNASDTEEIKELLKIGGVKRYSPNLPGVMIFRSSNFGRIIVSKGFLFLLDERVIMDRNTLLMCKDTYIARFQTLFSMINRTDDEFRPDDWQELSRIYQIGDHMLSLHGCDAYDSIKLVESMCSLRVAELARNFRPLIPEFPSYREHIEDSVREIANTNPLINNLFELIERIETPELALTVYGSFRHWGHPYLDYLEGLDAVHTQVTMQKNIDREYAEKLASDLAFIILKQKFTETKRWYVSPEGLPNDHILRQHITHNTWPTPKQMLDFGDNWHTLPLLKCFDVPDMIDPSIIYADKSHSMDRSEILRHVQNNPNNPVPSRKVLQSLLKKKETNWREFLEEVDTVGLSNEDLAIGLKGKEREIKVKGRFFTLMTWRLREYFVVTEYLIKTHFVPLFRGLTMADDLNTVIKKLIDNTSGQGNEDYNNICIANHIDYTKWNNHQRDEANRPVFNVMDRFLGFKNLISRTHEMFQRSMIYYNGRPDLMRVEGDHLINRTRHLVTWNGQDGGLEGLRQKGWSVVNLLVIRRESMNRNTKTTLLAQGDNQVICGKYKLQKTRNDQELREAIDGIVRENDNIMNAIERGTERLGLIINRDETLQSADYLVYGKVPIFRGSIRGLETKRWSRVTCVTNDQLPTLANTMSSISSNALTVAHFSNSPINAIVHYNFLGNFGRILLEIHNPALKSQLAYKIKKPERLRDPNYKILVLYLDPCLGGVCGMSLTRFLSRGFPDPVTESLVFWKVIHNNTEIESLKKLSCQIGSPKMGDKTIEGFKKLIENPSSLNISGGVNPQTMIKEEIKNSLIKNSSKIKNEVMKDAIRYMTKNEAQLMDYMRSIKPLFPRFLSEYLSGTYLGIVQSLVSLFQNSRTIRTIFSKKIDKRIISIIVKSEVQAIEALCDIPRRIPKKIWNCSSTKADSLRRESWGEKVYGATIPHPMELLGKPIKQGASCEGCDKPPPASFYVSILVPNGLSRYKENRGPYKAYLGSKTSETTSVLRPWEREAKVPLIKRAAKLRNAIGWFVDGDSKLGQGIMQNLEALTGERWDVKSEGAKRTGSALHRFACSRQSSAGYAAISPSKLTWMCMTTDTLSTLNSINHDFMHQSLLIYTQATVAELMDGSEEQGYYHHHISCIECLREIDEITLDTHLDFTHANMSEILRKWKPEGTEWSQTAKIQEIPRGNWGSLTPMEQSYHLGRACGFLYGELKMSADSRSEDSSIFPLSLQGKVFPRQYMEGLLDGLIRASSIHCVSRRSITELKRPREALLGVGLHLIKEVSNHAGLITMWRSEIFEDLFMEVPYKVPPSYPLSNTDLGALGRSFMRYIYIQRYVECKERPSTYPNIWIFADINDVKIVGMMSISKRLMDSLYKRIMTKSSKEIIRSAKDKIIALRDPDRRPETITVRTNGMYRVDEEIRHASKAIVTTKSKTGAAGKSHNHWKNELVVPIQEISIPYVYQNQDPAITFDQQVPRIQNPLISGLRSFQFATGSHYKIRSIIVNLKISYRDALGGGDGSGGICSYLIRSNKTARVIFNSLLKLDDVDLRGATPSPPSAISALGSDSSRCVNFRSAWENPSDLSDDATWKYFLKLKKNMAMHIDLMVFDVECESEESMDRIEDLLSTYVFQLLSPTGTLIFKTYLQRLMKQDNKLLYTVGNQFQDISIVTTDITSSQSSEIYVVMRNASSLNLQVVPDKRIIIENLRNLAPFRTRTEEFERAMKLTKYNMYKGVPRHMIVDGLDDLMTHLEQLGVEAGVAAVLEETIKLGRSGNNPETPYMIYLVCINALLKLTAMYKEIPNPPSDSKVYKLGVLMVGFMNWIAISTNNPRLHIRAQNMIDDCFQLSWATFITKKKDNKPILYMRKYAVQKKLAGIKSFHLDAYMAKIGGLIRCLYKVFGSNKSEPDKQKISELIKVFDNGLSLSLFNKLFNLEEVLTTDIQTEKDRVTGKWKTTKMEEGGWTS